MPAFRGRHLRSAALRLTSAAALILAGILAGAAAAEAKKLTVVATIGQIGEPVAWITDGRAEVETLMGEGVDPHLYRPTRSDIARLTRADVILFNGLTLEAQLLRPISRLKERAKTLAIAETLRENLRLPYDGGPGDPHVWMDPALWAQALRAAVDLIKAEDPANAAYYENRAGTYFAKLADLETHADKAIDSIPQGRRSLVTAHDAFGYFGRRFGIDVRGIQGISTQSEAGLRAVEELVGLLVDKRIPAVFVETSVSDRHVRALIDGARARGHLVTVGGSLYSDAMGSPGTYEGTYLGMIDHNVTVIARALGGKAPERGWQGRLDAGAD